jgi:hypothetical protein
MDHEAEVSLLALEGHSSPEGRRVELQPLRMMVETPSTPLQLKVLVFQTS